MVVSRVESWQNLVASLQGERTVSDVIKERTELGQLYDVKAAVSSPIRFSASHCSFLLPEVEAVLMLSSIPWASYQLRFRPELRTLWKLEGCSTDMIGGAPNAGATKHTASMLIWIVEVRIYEIRDAIWCLPLKPVHSW